MAEPQATATKSPRLPEGTVLDWKQVKLKEGYATRPLADGKVALMGQDSNAIEGTFECSCSGGDKGCALSTKGSVMFRLNQGNCRNCVLLVTISEDKNVIQ